MTAIPQTLLDLVERYHHNRDRYRRPDYNETQVRREFIDPFFEALGWDVANSRGVAPQYREVVHEAALRDRAARSGVVAPDYAFRVGPERKFFVEAKKPAVDIRTDPSPAYQLRRYAWTARLPLSVLTDFEELSVYDCRYKPAQGDGAAQARVVALTYDQYPTRWPEIAGLLGREAVWRGDFDRYVESTRAKRGTQAVDDAFLAEIEGWRVALARNIALRNPSLSVRDMNYAVGKLIDRLIFLRICEDREIEPYGQLREAIGGGDVYNHLLALFRRADDRYNSGLFHFGVEKGRSEPADTLAPSLAIDDRVLKEIVSGLYYPASPYEFSVLGTDILGSVYERFLGSVIRLTPAHRAVVDQKPEVRKAGGVYYTPQYIVDYIVEHTLGPLLEGKTPGQVASLRILDPACGSGSFLLGAYQYLLDWHLRWYTEHPTATPRRELYPGPDGVPRLTGAERKRILLNNIHGVDIDAQAVEVTKLSLLLKVLEGETSTSLQLELLPERALPDLGANVQCGNSLIGPDIYDGQQMALLGEDEWERVNPFDWAQAFPEAMAAGGFDAVIGNPPYIRIQTLKEWAPQEVEFYKRRYVAASRGNYDIYVVFVEKGLSLLNERGRLGFILPHKFFNAQYGEPLRRLLAEGQHLSEIVHFGDQQVFGQATTYTCLLMLSKSASEQCAVKRVTQLGAWISHGQATAGNVLASRIGPKEWNLVVGPETDLFHRLDEAFPKLGDVSFIFVGLQTSADPVFLFKEWWPIDQATTRVSSAALGSEVVLEAEILRPVIRSGSIGRYWAQPTALVLFPYYIVNGSAQLIDERQMKQGYPQAWAYLGANRRALSEREHGKFAGTGWYQLYPKNLDLWDQPKVMLPYMVTRLSAFYDTGKSYFVNVTTGGFGLTVSQGSLSAQYLTGLLNSRLLDWFMKRVSTSFHGGYFAANKQYLVQLPTRSIDFSVPADVARHDCMVALVERMLALHEDLAAARAGAPHRVTPLERQIAATDAEIDRLVYELYGLTDEEVRLVQG